MDLDVKRADLNNLHSWRKNLEKVFKYLFRSSETTSSSIVRVRVAHRITSHSGTVRHTATVIFIACFVYTLISQWLNIFFYEQTTLCEGET